MNTPFSEVFNSFLSRITDYSVLTLNEEEINEEFNLLMKKALAKFKTKKNLKPDYELGEFNRELDEMEILIISLAMVSEWLQPKILSVTLLKPSLSMKDYQQFSEANQLDKLMALKKITDKDFHYWMQQYSLQSRIRGEK